MKSKRSIGLVSSSISSCAWTIEQLKHLLDKTSICLVNAEGRSVQLDTRCRKEFEHLVNKQLQLSKEHLAKLTKELANHVDAN